MRTEKEPDLNKNRDYIPNDEIDQEEKLDIRQQKKANVYIGEYEGADPKEYDHMYAAGKCLKCGLCLEVCPNYLDGSSFYGAAFANDCFLIASRSKSRKTAITKSYQKNFEQGCSKALSCVDVCPMKIPTLASIAKMNRR